MIMKEIIKHINDTNASYRDIMAGDAKNTDLFLDNEHFAIFEGKGEQIIVRFDKKNLSQSILFIASILPRKYDNSNVHKKIEFSSSFVLEQLAILEGFFMENGKPVSKKTQIWNLRKDIPKKNGTIDTRFYFNGLLEDIVYTFNGNSNIGKFTVRNYLAGGYSDLHIKEADDGIFDLYITNALQPHDDGSETDITEEMSTEVNVHESLQQIFYGAPGTGKSNTIKRETANAEKDGRVIRTTFHPDSDYSTFVGAYKPSMKPTDKIYSVGELAVKLKEIKNSGVTYPCHKFAAQYWRSLKDLTTEATKQILTACEFKESMAREISKGVVIGQEYLNKDEDGKIIYTFCPQAFTNAYVKAWNTEKDVYLVIEEINRGNCAQIFGDLFQLLDRKNGVSEYPIEADTDLRNYLQKELADTERKDIPENVKSGEKLMLPKNFYIWATMNTSDQSLFPIDSAFKRRWEWKYMKIKNHPEENYRIKIGEKEQDWWEFVKKINEIIASMTSSADKQLGYFFCCAKDGVIDEDTFVSKVIFYLWNDVFKDYGFEDASLFRYKDENGVEHDLTFPDFYDEDGEKVNTERLTDFVKKVMDWKKENAENG